MSKKSRINTQEIASRFISSIPNEKENEVEEKRVEIKTEKKEGKKTRPFIKDGGYSQRRCV